ncbi:hypothetical protein VKT23_005069 [Stygiomarasmius scandens]|uniref:Phosphatidylserine decarboxylase n=1 Tax=Marasmiellus scandens TaxID=2682957 RepID=A0ABR1JS19_9AGAR
MACGLLNPFKRKSEKLDHLSSLTTSSISPQHLHSLDKPVDTSSAIPDASPDALLKALDHLVTHSTSSPDISHSTDAYALNLVELPSSFKSLLPGLQRLAAKYHIGNYVIVRSTDEVIFESMPLYARIGMHLLFHGDAQVNWLLKNKTVKDVLREQSVRQGKIYDSPESVGSIESFVKTYNINLDELLEPDINKYTSFNEFFYRQLKPGARPVQDPEDPTRVCSMADSRLTVYPTVDMAKEFWVKSHVFNIPRLLNVPLYDFDGENLAMRFNGGSLAIFRLAPADYHRFHCPVDAIIEDIVWVGFEGSSPEGSTVEPTPVPENGNANANGNADGKADKKAYGYHHQSPGQGTYYTVNPQAINQDLAVLESNVRSILYLRLASSSSNETKGPSLAVVAIGALLVGSVVWTGGAKPKGTLIKKGEELGYFKYGGSTVIAVWEKECGLKWDEDLVRASSGMRSKEKEKEVKGPVEMLVRVGESIGKMV